MYVTAASIHASNNAKRGVFCMVKRVLFAGTLTCHILAPRLETQDPFNFVAANIMGFNEDKVHHHPALCTKGAKCMLGSIVAENKNPELKATCSASTVF